MRLREMVQADNPKVKRLVQVTLEGIGFDKPGTAYVDPELGHLYDYYQANQPANYWVIEEQGEIIGGVGIAPYNEEGVCELQKMYVAKPYQGQGLAKQLIEEALTFAKGHYNVCYLETHTELTVAYHLYESFGFTLLERPLEGTVHSAMDRWYMKEL